jgi:hypothetical protein
VSDVPEPPELPYVPDPTSPVWRWIDRVGAHTYRLSALVVICAGCVTWAAVWGPSYPYRTTLDQTEYSLDGWVVGILVAALVLGILALFAMLSAYATRQQVRNSNLRSRRVKRLTESLTEALKIIEGIKYEVEEGEALLQRLKQDTQTTKALAELSQPEADAVRSLVASTVRRERLPNLGIALATAIIGAVIGLVIGHFWL